MQHHITALLDMTSTNVSTGVTTIDTATCAIPIMHETDCEHGETVCSGCIDSWAMDYIIIDTTRDFPGYAEYAAI